MRHLFTLLFVPALFASGCIVYDEELVYDDELAERPADQDPSDDPMDPEPGSPMWLVPAAGAQGDVLIVALTSEGPFDLTEIAAISFFGEGDIAILATAEQTTGSFLMTLDIAPGAEPSSNHLLVEFEDGSAEFVEDAFAITSSE